MGRKWECTKNSPKTQQIRHLGMAHGVTALCHTFLKSSFKGQHFCHIYVVYLYLGPFESNGTSKLTILKKSLHKFNVFGTIADSHGGLPPCAIHL